jgi:DNA-directed RNA polymerase subunit M/transcription elongation factor TFIIS
MKFCETCQNMLYVKLDAENSSTLVYYCRYCGNTKSQHSADDMMIIDSKLKKSKINFANLVNKYTKHDPTLPHLLGIKCPNENCTTNHAQDGKPAAETTEAIYMRYNDDDLLYLYICKYCDFVWTTQS